MTKMLNNSTTENPGLFYVHAKLLLGLAQLWF
jgi:hypothetical protein